MEPDDTRSAELLAYRQRGRFHRNATKALLSNTLMYFLIVFVSFLKISFNIPLYITNVWVKVQYC